MQENFQENKVVITDASCFILLQKLNLLHILNDLFAEVITTPEIANEFGFELPGRVDILPVKNSLLKAEFENYIDLGEASAIALASEIKFDYLILDDAEARRFAEKLGLPIKGTAGVLLAAKQQGFISMLRPYFDSIQQANFRISQALINYTLKQAGEI